MAKPAIAIQKPAMGVVPKALAGSTMLLIGMPGRVCIATAPPNTQAGIRLREMPAALKKAAARGYMVKIMTNTSMPPTDMARVAR